MLDSKELASLHKTYGYGSIKEFVKALRTSTGKAPKARKGKGAPKAKRRKRAIINDETRANVKKLVESGKTGSQIAKSLGISLPSVQNIKKALGMVKARA